MRLEGRDYTFVVDGNIEVTVKLEVRLKDGGKDDPDYYVPVIRELRCVRRVVEPVNVTEINPRLG